MCRLFALRADRPVCAGPALVSAPHALVTQSCCDLRGECHPSGWGVGYFRDGDPVRVQSVRAASEDPGYAQAARTAVSPTIIGHVRQASVGRVSEANTHPFAHGRWLFAHNGTVEGFAQNPDPLRELIPAGFRQHIRGETDSEHLFYVLLGRIEQLTTPAAATVAGVMAGLIREVAGLHPGSAEDPTRLNFVLTDGDVFLASRWGHTLHLADLADPRAAGVIDAAGPVRGVAVASEPVTPAGWREVPDRSIVAAWGDGTFTVTPCG